MIHRVPNSQANPRLPGCSSQEEEVWAVREDVMGLVEVVVVEMEAQEVLGVLVEVVEAQA